MLLKYALCISAVVLATSAASVRAGMTGTTQVAFSGDTTIVLPDPSLQGNPPLQNTFHALTWSIDGGGVGQMNLTDNAPAITSDTHTYTQTVDGDPKTILLTDEYNDSGVAWSAFDVSIASETDGVTVAFIATSTPITTPASSPAWQDSVNLTGSAIHFSGVSSNTPLADGADTNLAYTILITPPNGYKGSITYCITSTPTLAPEPASLLVLSAGALGLLGRRRR
jgi:hypothetical protein